ncbi:MAG: trigger factor, partial [Planctomycetes bacterium]|nr:trigger factor [Planctomycetota bacterium]
MTEDQTPVGADEEAEDGQSVATEELDEDAKLKEAIDVQTEDVGQLRKKVVVTIPREIIDERQGEQFSELKREAMVPGFRKGRAPMKLIEKRFGTEVGDQLVSQLVGKSYLAALEKADIKAVGDPFIWVTVPDEDSGDGREDGATIDKLVSVDEALSILELPSEGPMTISCEVEIQPEFEVPDLEGIAVQKPQVTITDGDVDAEVERFRATRGHFVPVEKGAIEEDDLIVADVTMLVEGKVAKTEQNVALAARPQRVDGVPVENLGEALVGRSAGETVEVKATIGDDHEKLEYRGKEAIFKLDIHEVKRLSLPDLDKDFVATLGFDSIDELKEFLKASLEARLATTIRRGMRGQVQKYLLENAKMEVPDRLSQRQTDRLVAKRMVEMYRMGLPQQAIEKRADELRTTARADAVNELKLFFVMEKIAEKYDGEGIEGKRVAQIITFGKLQARAVIRDVGRVMGIPYAEVDRIAKLVPDTLGITLPDALEQSAELRSRVDSDG